MKVMLADVESPAVEAAAATLTDEGGDVEYAVTDVSHADAVDALARTTLERFGAVHVACNNAGVSSGGPAWQVPLPAWRWAMGGNLHGVVHGISALGTRTRVRFASPARALRRDGLRGGQLRGGHRVRGPGQQFQCVGGVQVLERRQRRGEVVPQLVAQPRPPSCAPGPGSPHGTASPMSRSPAATSPSRGRGCCAGH